MSEEDAKDLRREMQKLMKESVEAREQWKAGEHERMCQYGDCASKLRRIKPVPDPDDKYTQE